MTKEKFVLPAQFKSELEGARIVGGAGLAGIARTRDGIAEWADVAHVETIKHVEAVSNHFQIKLLPDRELPRDSQIDLEKAGPGKCIAREIAHAPERGRRHGQVIREGFVRRTEALCRNREVEALHEGRIDDRQAGGHFPGGKHVRAIRCCSQVEVRIRADQDVEGPARSDFDDRGNGEVLEEFSRKAGVAATVRALEHRAGNPAVALVEVGVAALPVGIVVVLRIQESREIG